MYKIEKNIPIPSIPKKNLLKYPFNEMEIGDSFFVPWSEEEKKSKLRMQRKRTSILGSARNLKSNKIKIKTRKSEDGIRIWKVE